MFIQAVFGVLCQHETDAGCTAEIRKPKIGANLSYFYEKDK